MELPNRTTAPRDQRPPGRRYGRTVLTSELKGEGRRGRTRQAPPAETNAENFYYLKQMNARTPMVVVLNDGEELRGCIEWYDKTCLKLNRIGSPNVLVQKHSIKYLFKEEELEGERD